MYRFYLDGTELDDAPDGWDKFAQTINRDVAQRRITISYPVDLVFYGRAFNVFYDAINNGGYNATFEFKAIKEDEKGVLVSDINGIIFLIDVEFNLTERTATTQIKENGFIAKLLGNLNNPISLPSLQTKNGFDMSSDSRVTLKITSSTPAMGGLTVFNNNAGGTTSDRFGVDVWKALQEMVVNMSDGKVAIKSDYFDDKLSDYNSVGNPYLAPLCMISGKELRLGSDAREGDGDYALNVSFNELFEAVSRIFNLYFYPDTTVQPPIINIEGESGFYPTDGTTAEVESPEQMTLSYFQELFYSTVKMGCPNSKYEAGNPATNIPKVPLKTFASSSYFLTGESNVDRELDLTVSRFVIDSNIIRDVLVNDNNSYDNQMFLMQYIPKEATFDDPYFGVITYDRPASFEVLDEHAFNGALTSYEIAKNHNFFGQITQNLTDIATDNRLKYVGNASNIAQFIALSGQPYISADYNPQYSDIEYDYSVAQWNATNSTYIAQKSGVYSVNIKTVIEVPTLQTTVSNVFEEALPVLEEYLGGAQPTGDTLTALIHLNVYSGATIVNTVVLSSSDFTSTGLRTIQTDATVDMNANEVLKVAIVFVAHSTLTWGGKPVKNIGWSVKPGGHFEVNSCPDLKLSYVSTEQTLEYKGTRVALDHFMTEAQIKKVIAKPEQPIKLLNFVEMGDTKTCWIKNLKINRETGGIEGELITNIVKETL